MVERSRAQPRNRGSSGSLRAVAAGAIRRAASRGLASAAGAAYLMAMADAPNKKLRIAGAVVLFGALFAMLIAAGWHAVGAWNAMSGAPMPTTAYVAMILGVVFSLVVGCGLMALLFYSSRHGYDDLQYDEPHESDDPDESEHEQQQ
jgi:hypothetical protein